LATLNNVSGVRQSENVLSLLIALVVFVGTALQTLVALVDVRAADGHALQVDRAEDELAIEQPLWRRRRTRRELRSWREPETDRSLALIDAVLFSWALLMFAAAAATAKATIALW
jgi:hypothetical protein